LHQGAGGVGQHGGKTAEHGQGQHDVCGDQFEEEVGVPGGMKKALALHMKSCPIVESRKTYEDFEKNVYLHLALKFDRIEVDKEMDDDDDLKSEANQVEKI
jgi:hypothetical protein